VRLPRIIPLGAAALALAIPAPAAAGGGGAAAPREDVGGATFGTEVPKKRRPLVRGRFPVAGPFSYGGRDSRFGARRRGHRHQGQDLAAALGTPVVAPAAGLVEWVRYQRRGAGHYVVIDAGRLHYVFMHLRAGSVRVSEGERVRAGRQIAEVADTGRSFGPHLHFEVWAGGWRTKAGRPLDPLPLLRRWD
jgi:murein DD-endopeptidase MepM/ murein hydrolase activator NlpD